MTLGSNMDISEWSLTIDKCIWEGDKLTGCICVLGTLRGSHRLSPSRFGWDPNSEKEILHEYMKMSCTRG